MAEVLRARVTGVGGFQRDVVLKRLLHTRAADPEIVNMFKDEARILGALHHQNVVQALDFDEHDGKLFLVLEYVEGPSLSRVLRARPEGIPAVIAAYIGREICHALDYVHGFRDADGTPLGLIHRDVTPSNVIVTRTGAVKLLDFGVAKFAKATQATRAGTVKGKTAYVAPEQLREGTPIDGRVDLFTLGAVLHELVVGQRLFAAEHDLGCLKKITELKIPLPSIVRPGVPPAMDRIIMKALQRDPARRYPSAAAMARDLDEVVLAARLRASDVGSYVRDLVGPVAGVAVPPPVPVHGPAIACAPTRRDLALPLRVWMSSPLQSRGPLAAGLAVCLGIAGALGLGMKLQSLRAARLANTRQAALACPTPPTAIVSSTIPVSTVEPPH
jgi:serine/threonine-protein kinase